MQPYIVNPTESDILCGKDKTYAKHSGNQVFRAKIMSYSSIYKEAATKPQKMKLTRQIVNEMKENCSARFLRPIENCGVTVWEEITDQQARDKTSHALRFAINGNHSRRRRRGSIGSSSESSIKTKSTCSGHRRVNSDATDTTMLSIESSMSLKEEKEHQPASVVSINITETDLFQRQQAILRQLKHDMEVQLSKKATRTAPDRCASIELISNLESDDEKKIASTPFNLERFDSLDSKDFNDFLNDPIDCDWENPEIPNYTSCLESLRDCSI